MKKLIVAIVISVGFYSSAALVCSCIRIDSIANILDNYDVIVSAEVVSLSRDRSSRYGLLNAHLKVLKAYKGVPQGAKTLVVNTIPSSAACGINYQVGENMLIFGTRTKEKGISTMLCSPTKRLKYAQKELEILKNIFGD